jgi:hypothetical protein
MTTATKYTFASPATIQARKRTKVVAQPNLASVGLTDDPEATRTHANGPTSNRPLNRQVCERCGEPTQPDDLPQRGAGGHRELSRPKSEDHDEENGRVDDAGGDAGQQPAEFKGAQRTERRSRDRLFVHGPGTAESCVASTCAMIPTRSGNAVGMRRSSRSQNRHHITEPIWWYRHSGTHSAEPLRLGKQTLCQLS